MFALEDTILYYLLYMLCKEQNFTEKVKKLIGCVQTQNEQSTSDT